MHGSKRCPGRPVKAVKKRLCCVTVSQCSKHFFKPFSTRSKVFLKGTYPFGRYTIINATFDGAEVQRLIVICATSDGEVTTTLDCSFDTEIIFETPKLTSANQNMVGEGEGIFFLSISCLLRQLKEASRKTMR